MRRALTLLPLLMLGGLAAAQTSPFVEPPFASQCVVHHFDEGEPPPLDGCGDDPFCVEYEKRDITGTNGGAIRFLAAEPDRFAAAIPKCRYWQQDHWRIQASPTDPTVLQWDGSYWFDKGNGIGGARLRNFAIGGQPASPNQMAALIELLDPELAAVIRQYGEEEGGGGGSTFELGDADPSCQTPVGDSTCYESLEFSRAQAAAESRCDCATAQFHGNHVRCVKGVATEEVGAGRLPPECAPILVRCAKRSVCGRKSGAVTCFRTTSRGVTKCGIKRDPGACRPPSGGSAAVGSGPSCCDPRLADGCS